MCTNGKCMHEALSGQWLYILQHGCAQNRGGAFVRKGSGEWDAYLVIVMLPLLTTQRHNGVSPESLSQATPLTV